MRCNPYFSSFDVIRCGGNPPISRAAGAGCHAVYRGVISIWVANPVANWQSLVAQLFDGTKTIGHAPHSIGM
jgi:hypothetical protein